MQNNRRTNTRKFVSVNKTIEYIEYILNIYMIEYIEHLLSVHKALWRIKCNSPKVSSSFPRSNYFTKDSKSNLKLMQTQGSFTTN